MRNTPIFRGLMLAGLAIALAGCNDAPAPANETAAAPQGAAGQEAPAAESPGAPAQVGPDFRLDTAIPEKDIDTDLALAATPAYRPEEDMVLLQVEVRNAGRSALVGKGEMPVQLAATLAGPQGVDEAPGKRNFVKVPLPLVQPGGSANVGMRIPAADILGLGLKLELLQERAGWFGRRYGQPVLDVGTFQRCDGAAATLCDASGTPVRIVEAPAAGEARDG